MTDIIYANEYKIMCNAIYIITYQGSRDNVETKKEKSDNHNAQIDLVKL